VVFIGVVGFAHTKTGKDLLRYLPSPGSACPLGYDTSVTPEQRDSLRTAVLSEVRGTSRTNSRDAFAFALGQTTHAEAIVWANKYGVTCTEVQAGAAMRCLEVSAQALADSWAADALLLRFNAEGVLVTVDASRQNADADVAAAYIDQRKLALSDRMGPESSERGQRSGAYLRSGRLAQAKVEFRFSDLRALVSATNMGQGRILVRESYQAIDDV